MTIKISADAIMAVKAAIMTQQVEIKLMQDIVWAHQGTINLGANIVQVQQMGIKLSKRIIQLPQTTILTAVGVQNPNSGYFTLNA